MAINVDYLQNLTFYALNCEKVPIPPLPPLPIYGLIGIMILTLSFNTYKS